MSYSTYANFNQTAFENNCIVAYLIWIEFIIKLYQGKQTRWVFIKQYIPAKRKSVVKTTDVLIETMAFGNCSE